MQKNIIVRQTGFKDCAVSCLLSIIRYYKGNISKEELLYLVNTNQNGTSAYHMIEGMRKIGFDGLGRKINTNDLLKDNIICPFIVHVKNQEFYHFIVIYEINTKRKYLVAMDPAIGKRKITFDEFDKIYLNSVLEFSVINELPNIKEKEKLFTLIISLIRINKNILIKLFLISLFSSVFTIGSSFSYKIILDSVTIENYNKLISIILICFTLIIVLKNLLSFLRDKLLTEFKEKISKDITIKIFRHIFNLPYQYLKNKPTGEIISRINDINNLYDFILSIFLNLFINLFLIIMSLIVLMIINIRLTIITVYIFIFYIFLVIFYFKIIKRKIIEVKTSHADYNRISIESIENYESIKNLKINIYILDKIKNSYYKFLRNLKELEQKIIKENYYKELITDTLNLIILVTGSYLVITNKITVGNLILYLTILSFYIIPLKDLLNLILNYNQSLTSYERINDLLLINTEKINSEDYSMINGDIVFENVFYSHDKVNNILSNIDFKIEKNSKYLIHGKSGEGKSTLMKILVKYLKNYSGEIYIGNYNLKDIKLETINNSILYVSQNENIFNGTLKENIILNKQINNKKYEEILKICKVDKIRNKKTFRDNFLIEENGFNLSGGEKQRIILARALLNNFNYLILDECLSEIDSSLEKEIIQNIFDYFKDKTIIYITHKEEIKKLFNEVYEC